MRFAKILRSGDRMASLPPRRRQQGQIAVAFIVFMALILLLAPMVMNLGEVARLKTATANAADAGALAGASWVASGENGMVPIAEAMWANVLLVELIFIGPWCMLAVWLAFLLWALLNTTNGVLLYGQAKEIMDAAWDNAHDTIVLTALANAGIDDQSGDIQKTVKQWVDNEAVPSPPVTLTWTRMGADGNPDTSTVTVNYQFTNGKPDLEMISYGTFYWYWLIQCIWCAYVPCCCWWPVGWNGIQYYAGYLPYPSFGSCYVPTCWPWFGYLPGIFVQPDGISDDEGDITVTVTRTREAGNTLGFWRTRYPDEVRSSATAHYTGASVDLWPSQDARARLMSVR